METFIRHLVWLLFAAMPAFVLAGSTDEEEAAGLALSFGDEEMVSIATGHRQPIAKAPAVATVITADDIKAIGARDLDEVLETVPGLHVTPDAAGYNPQYVIRGIYSEFNAQVLVLINGIPITNVFVGNRGEAWGGMPVEGIQRIEVMRGPGSALYGADAFAGVINIITKRASNIDGTEAGGRVGSNGYYEGWLLYGGDVGGWDVAVTADARTTNGQDETIDADAQTNFDNLFFTSASLAPGGVNTGLDSLDVRLDAHRGRWRLRAGYQGRRNGGTGAGAAEALDPVGEGESDRFNADLTYHNPAVHEHWDVKAQASFYNVANKTELVLFPPGADFTSPIPFYELGGGPFPEGVLGNPEVYERHYRFDLSAFYTAIANHDLRFGAGYVWQDMYKIEDSKNYFLSDRGFPVPLEGGMQEGSEDAAFITPHDRTDAYAFAQDEWSIAPDWELLAGVRYDRYSDFGSTVNPRLALVWQTAYNLTSKLLYGSGFRPPSFAEQFNINNPIALGYEDLDPEKINTVELAFDYQPLAEVRTGLNLFYYKWKDIIRFVAENPTATTARADNTGDQTGYGLEAQLVWDITRSLRLNANYAFQKGKDKDADADPGIAPIHQFYARADWRFLPKWMFNAQVNYIGDRKRQPGDDRPEIDNYTTVDLVVRHRGKSPKGFEFAFSVRNLFDADAREPSLAPGLIPNDLPLAGRNVYGELRYRW